MWQVPRLLIVVQCSVHGKRSAWLLHCALLPCIIHASSLMEHMRERIISGLCREHGYSYTRVHSRWQATSQRNPSRRGSVRKADHSDVQGRS